MTTYREILFASRYLDNITRFYGWPPNISELSLGSMVRGLESLQDWRVDALLQFSRQFGLDLTMPGSVLEVGFGTGSLTILAKKRGIGICGIDYTAEYLAYARQLAECAGFNDGEIFAMFKRGNVEKLDIPDNSFTAIICTGVLQFINDPITAMREMLRVLRPGGFLFLDAPDYRFPFEAQYQIPWLPFMPRELAYVWLEGFEKPLRGLDYIKYVSLPQTIGLLTAAGYTAIDGTTTLAETEIATHVDRITAVSKTTGYLLNDPDKVYALARSLRRNQIQIPGCAFKVVGRKPAQPAYPGR